MINLSEYHKYRDTIHQYYIAGKIYQCPVPDIYIEYYQDYETDPHYTTTYPEYAKFLKQHNIKDEKGYYNQDQIALILAILTDKIIRANDKKQLCQLTYGLLCDDIKYMYYHAFQKTLSPSRVSDMVTILARHQVIKKYTARKQPNIYQLGEKHMLFSQHTYLLLTLKEVCALDKDDEIYVFEYGAAAYWDRRNKRIDTAKNTYEKRVSERLGS